jgi:hypothetical protein
MAMYEDFDLDVTVGTNVDDSTKAITFRTGCGTCNDCLSNCDTCGDCSMSCGGVSTMPCDR